MAGDWIKMRVDLGTSPKVVRISSALRADRLRVIGGLHAVWCLFDVHSVDGKLEGYTLEALDDLIGFEGFGAAMVSVGWLENDGQSLCTPRFDEHNGQSAKRRANETERKREARKVSAPDADKMRSREEKRREEKSTSSLRSEEAHDKKPKASAIVAETLPLPTELDRQTWRDWVSYRSSIRKPLKHETAEKQIQFLCESIATGHDPVAIINDSIRNGWTGLFSKDNHKRGAAEKVASEGFYEREQRLKRERWEEMTGRKWPTDKASDTIDITPTTLELNHEPFDQSH